MPDLAVLTDVEDSMGRSLTADENMRALTLISLASAYVEATTGYRFAPGSYTVGRRVRNGKVHLPATVASVEAVRWVDEWDGTVTDATGWSLHGNTIYGLEGPRRNRPVHEYRRAWTLEVDFTVTAPVPVVVARVVAGIVAATLLGPAVGAASETAGPFSISYVNSSGKVWLSASDKAILGRYTQPKPAIDMIG